MGERRIECSEHGWQPVVLYTRYDPKSRPRDVPDREVCMVCAREGRAFDEGNSIRIAPEALDTQLRVAIDVLSRHFHRWHEPSLAAAVRGTLDGPTEDLPRRVLALFTHGMGGLLDRPLCTSDGHTDAQATHRRDLLADDLWRVARECLADDPRGT